MWYEQYEKSNNGTKNPWYESSMERNVHQWYETSKVRKVYGTKSPAFILMPLPPGILPVLVYPPRKDERLESIWVAGYTKMVYPHMVTHPSINRAQRRVTSAFPIKCRLKNHACSRP